LFLSFLFVGFFILFVAPFPWRYVNFASSLKGLSKITYSLAQRGTYLGDLATAEDQQDRGEYQKQFGGPWPHNFLLSIERIFRL
jgi:hypothetical protein